MAEDWFDKNASEYDAWFDQNRNVLASEVLLLAHLVGDDPGRALSVGCGTGLFEGILRAEHGIEIGFGVEPAEGMAQIARERGLTVEAGTAEALPQGDAEFDTVIMNGSPSYMDDLKRAVDEARRVLRPGGHLVMLDVPAESSYGLLYRLAAEIDDWRDAFLSRVAPPHPYPIEFAKAANWRTTGEKLLILREAGFTDLYIAQTLTRHPKYSDDEAEQPVEGYDRGDYVGIRGVRAP